MSDRQDESQDLAELAGLPADDPRLRALDARTRARLHAYRAFVGGEPPAGARVSDAERTLAERLGRETGVPIGAAQATSEGARRATPARAATESPAERGPRSSAERGPRSNAERGPMESPGGGGWLRALFSPGLKPAFAVAALVIVLGALWWVSGPRREGEEPILRGPDSTALQRGELGASATLSGGVLRLEWTPLPEAQTYTVVFQSPELVELARVEGLTAPHLELRRGSPPAGLVSGRPVLWRVTALRGTDSIGRSRAASITVP